MSSGAVSCYSYVNRKPKFPTKYHELLQPLAPATTLPVESSYLCSKPAGLLPHDVNPERQAEFARLVQGSDVAGIEAYLHQHSEVIDVNRFDDEFGQTPLHEACQTGHLELVELLVRYGADVRLTNRDGFSVVHLASFSGNSALLLYVMKLRK